MYIKKNTATPSTRVATTPNQTAQTTCALMGKYFNIIVHICQSNQTAASHASSSSSSSTSAPLNPAFLNTPTAAQSPAAKTVNPADVAKLLRLVAEGEQDQAEAMIKAEPALLLHRGDVTDLSGRKFENITAFQYAAWALDWHMWTMIQKYLPPSEQKAQAEEFETGAWVRAHGVTATQLIQNLMTVLRELGDNWPRWEDKECDAYWVKQVGGAQLYLPAHVINEYCRLDRSFYLRDFLELTLPRSRQFLEPKWSGQTDKHEWFDDGLLGQKLAVIRAGIIIGAVNSRYVKPEDWQHYAYSDLAAMSELLAVRTSQRTQMEASLKNMSTNTNVMKK